MDIAWTDFGTAIALVLVIEGFMPFLAPASLRRAMANLAEAPDGVLRVAGFASMAVGLIVLYFVR